MKRSTILLIITSIGLLWTPAFAADQRGPKSDASTVLDLKCLQWTEDITGVEVSAQFIKDQPVIDTGSTVPPVSLTEAADITLKHLQTFWKTEHVIVQFAQLIQISRENSANQLFGKGVYAYLVATSVFDAPPPHGQKHSNTWALVGMNRHIALVNPVRTGE